MLRPIDAAASALALALLAGPVGAETFRWASTTDPDTMDPHAGNSAPVLGFLNNVYEGLVRRDEAMAIEPALATSWEPLEGEDGWRFHLREGVTFHDGADLTAEDVIFSYERASSEQADTASWFATVTEMRAPDDMTVEVLTDGPNPIFPDSIANWMIMDSGWAAQNGAETPARDAETHATRNANGTGPFRLTERQPGLRTVLEPFEGWWGEGRGDVTLAEFTPIQNSATAVAALLSGEVDLMNPVPIQDADRVDANEGTSVVRGIEARVIMLGFPHGETGADGEPNPFADPLVREAAAYAIDAPAILQTIMRGAAEPASQLVPAGLRGHSEGIEPYATDLERARALMKEAGYADGIQVPFKCPNDRYLNDESICQAIVPMLARAGIEARLEAMPVAQYWTELREGEPSLYLLGWSPGTFDAEHPMRFLAATPDGTVGTWNFGGYSNARVDELLPRIQSELDEGARQAMLDEAAGLIHDEVAYVPLHVEPLLWGVRDGVEVTQRTDNFLILRWIEME